MADIEVYSQGNAQKLRRHFAQCKLAVPIYITDVANSRTNAATGKDAPLIRLYVTDREPLSDILEELIPFNTEYEIQVAYLHARYEQG